MMTSRVPPTERGAGGAGAGACIAAAVLLLSFATPANGQLCMGGPRPAEHAEVAAVGAGIDDYTLVGGRVAVRVLPALGLAAQYTAAPNGAFRRAVVRAGLSFGQDEQPSADSAEVDRSWCLTATLAGAEEDPPAFFPGPSLYTRDWVGGIGAAHAQPVAGGTAWTLDGFVGAEIWLVAKHYGRDLPYESGLQIDELQLDLGTDFGLVYRWRRFRATLEFVTPIARHSITSVRLGFVL